MNARLVFKFGVTSIRYLVWLVILLSGAGSLVDARAQTIRYVKPGGLGNQSGADWANASGDLQAMINASSAGQQVWVARGTYKPGPVGNTDRSISFSMKEGVAIYGGFVGTETQLSQRAVITSSQPSSSTLSGDIGTVGNMDDNCYHVVFNFHTNLTTAAILDGFVLTGGNANGGAGTDGDAGGGIANLGASPTIRFCLFTTNAAGSGGAIYSVSSSADVMNCSFRNNSASYAGGAIYNHVDSPHLTNCLFFNNTAAFLGGAIYNDINQPVITNCSFTKNSAGYTGGGIFNNQNVFSVIANCILWGNTPNQLDPASNGGSATVKNSDLDQDGFAGQYGNIRQDPFFVDAAKGNLHVLNCSLTIDKGDNTATTTVNDYDGNPRVKGSAIDMGPFELQGTPTTPTLITTQPVAASAVAKGGSVFVSVSVSGPVLAYQWYRDGQPVIGQTTATLVLTNVAVAQAGQYVVTIKGSCNAVTSSPFILTVPTRFYVNANAGTSGDGLSWRSAFTNLQSALGNASAAEVWVAGGVYKPTADSNRDISFGIASGLKVYGGFAGNEVTLADRSLNTANRSLLSGDIGTLGNSGDNSYHVVTFNNASDQTRLDGFVITGGNASNSIGGGIYNRGQASNPVVVNCLITENQALRGGGVSNESTAYTVNRSTFINCVFSKNSADYGGAVYVTYPVFSDELSPTTFINCTFSQNSASRGGAFYGSSYDYPNYPQYLLINCIVWNNTGGGLYNGGSGDSYSVYTSDIDANDPLFVDATHGDFRLTGCSPVIDRGNSGDNTTDKDLAGKPRIIGSSVDLGAFEYQGQPGPPTASISTSTTVLNCRTMSATLTAGGGDFYQWNTGATTPTIIVTEAGAYSVVVSSANGCTVTASVSQTITSDQTVPTTSLTANGSISCTNPTVTLTALLTPGVTYRFSERAIQTGSGNTATVSSAGVYSVTVTSANGCSAVATTTVTGDQRVPMASLANDGPLSCVKTSVTLTASGEGAYRFSNGATQVGNGPTASVSTAGTYSVTVTSANGCSATATTTVASNTVAPTITIGPSATTVCAGSLTTLTASGGTTYRWSTGATTASISISAATSTTYSVTAATSGGCLATASTRLSVNPRPAAPYLTPLPRYLYTTNLPVPLIIYALPTGFGLDLRFYEASSNVRIDPSVIRPTQPGVVTYYATQTDNKGCASVPAPFSLTVLDGGTLVRKPADQTVCAGSSTVLSVTATGSNLSYSWYESNPDTPLLVNEVSSSSTRGGKTANLTINNVGQTKLYYCLVIGDKGIGGAGPIRVSLKTDCGAGARVATEEPTGLLQVRVLGNPVTGDEVRVIVEGADGQPLRLQLFDLTGRIIAERLIEKAGAVEQKQLPMMGQPAGLFVLRVGIPGQLQTLKVIKNP